MEKLEIYDRGPLSARYQYSKNVSDLFPSENTEKIIQIHFTSDIWMSIKIYDCDRSARSIYMDAETFF